MRKILTQSDGFTLVELLTAVGIFAIISGGAFAMYNAQQRSCNLQEQLVEVQQNVRAFYFFLEKDLRMAGYDVLKSGNAGFIKAEPYEVVFTADIGRPRTNPHCAGAGCDSLPDGEIIGLSGSCVDCVTETVRYSLSAKAGAPAISSYGKVVTPGMTTTVTKTFNGTTKTNEQDVVDNIEALEFLYNLSDGTAVTSVSADKLEKIRSVTVSLLARTRKVLTGTTDVRHYYAASGADWGVPNDPYRRNLVITNIQCRNMGLQNQN